ncbi:hypothetical protein BST61_g3502 [Cercospora zeina]
MSRRPEDQSFYPTRRVANDQKYPYAEKQGPRENPLYASLRFSTNKTHDPVGIPSRSDRIYQEAKSAFHAFRARQAEKDAIQRYAMTGSVDQAAARKFRAQHLEEKEQASSKPRARFIPINR